MSFEEKVYNAKIKFAYLGTNENVAGLHIQLAFDCGEGKSFYTTKRPVKNLLEISTILNTLSVASWEELSRKFVRIKVIDRTVIAIGNIIENDWLEWEK